ncbi:unnamed protein product, partial [Phaeothamnion confervicola]
SEAWNAISEARKGERPSSWPPHVALLHPFVRPPKMERAAEAIRDATATFSPFTLELSTFQVIAGGERRAMVWLVPTAEGDSLERLWTAVSAAVPGFENRPSGFRGPYSPHITIATCGSVKKAEAAAAALADSWHPLHFEVTSLDLMAKERGYKARFTRRATVALG